MSQSLRHQPLHSNAKSKVARPSFARRATKTLAVFLALAMPLALTLAEAEARVGGGSSSGSRGSRTFSAPPLTRTAPNAARPMERTITQPSTPSAPSAGQTNPGIGASNTAARPGGGFFNRPGLMGGVMGGLAAGFLGAGLFGMLSGNGFLGGVGSLMSFLGLVIQIVIVVFVARFIWSWWQRRNAAPAYAGAGARPGAANDMTPNNMSFREGAPGSNLGLGGALGGMFGGGAANSAAPQDAPQGTPIEIGEADYNAFEKLLSDIQAAWSNEDIAGLRAFATPEMVSYFSEDMTANAGRGVVNKVSDVKLLQGDLAEAWREDNTDYATVAMHFALVDQTIERASGRVVEGSTTPQEVTEVWTFRRDNGANWMLSAIQAV